MAKKVTDEEIKKIIEKYNEGNSIKSIAMELNYNWKTIANYLYREGISPSSEWDKGNRKKITTLFTREQDKIIAYQYNVENLSLNQLMEIYSCSMDAIRNSLKREKIETKNRGGIFKDFTKEQIQEIINLYTFNKLSQEKIAIKFEVSQSVISRILRNNGIIKGKISKEKHGNWKGGKITISGYSYVLLENNSPYYSMAHRGGYVAEHRLTMAQKLGRPLKQSESVHHIDGNRKNNNPNNLQLRHSNHGHGQKFCCADCGSKNIIPLELD